MMIKDNLEVKPDLGTLVIVPPGIKNDQSLLDRIRNYPSKSYHFSETQREL